MTVIKASKVPGGFVAHLPYGQRFTVNGDLIVISGHQGEDVHVPSLDAVKRWTRRTLLRGYKPREEGLESLTVDQYERRVAELLSVTEDAYDDDGDLTLRKWPSLDAEFAYKRFLASYSADRVTDWEEAEIEWSVVTYPETGSEFIVPVAQLGGEFQSALVVYNREAAMLAALRSAMRECDVSLTDVSMHQKPRTLKLYTHGHEIAIFGHKFSRKWGTRPWRGELAQAKAQLESDTKAIRDEIRVYARGDGPVDMTALDALSRLQHIESLVFSLDVKRKAIDDRRRASGLIRKLIEDVKRQAVGVPEDEIEEAIK